LGKVHRIEETFHVFGNNSSNQEEEKKKRKKKKEKDGIKEKKTFF
jgi:hypothetical protein